MSDPGELRVSDAEREAVVERLRQASVEGRLTLAELTERTEAAYLAVTYRELAQVTADLPDPGCARRPPPVPRTGAEAARDGSSRSWATPSGAASGGWTRRSAPRAVMGDVVIDLREAEVRGNEVDITAVSVMGDVKIIVPDGVDVDLDGVAVMGDKRVEVLEAPHRHGTPPGAGARLRGHGRRQGHRRLPRRADQARLVRLERLAAGAPRARLDRAPAHAPPLSATPSASERGPGPANRHPPPRRLRSPRHR